MTRTITTAVTRVTKDADEPQRRMRQLAEREVELQALARAGYSLTHSATVETSTEVVFVDTLVREHDPRS